MSEKKAQLIAEKKEAIKKQPAPSISIEEKKQQLIQEKKGNLPIYEAKIPERNKKLPSTERFFEGERNKLFAVPISEKFFEGEQNKLFSAPSGGEERQIARTPEEWEKIHGGGRVPESIVRTPEEWQMIKHPESLRKPQIPEDTKFKENKLKKEAERLQKKETGRTQKQQASSGFYTEIGYPQYEGKYEPFEIPKGKNILKIVESKKGLEVYWRPTKEEILAGYALSNELYKSNKFYASIGYPEYAGKYAPFTIPEGSTVSKITQTKQGLTINFITSAEPTTDISQLSPLEQEYLRVTYGGALPPASHFGPPSGYSSVPVNLDELVQSGKVTVAKLLNAGGGGVSFEPPTIAGYAELAEKYAGTSWVFAGQKASVVSAKEKPRGAEYTAGLEKQFNEKGLFDLIDVPAGYKLTNMEEVNVGPLGSELYPELAPLSKAKIITLEKQAATVAPSGMEQLSKSANPIVGGFAKNIVGAEQMQKDPVGYTTKKVLEIGGTVAALVNPIVAVAGAGLSVGIAQVAKSTGLQISLEKGVTFGPSGGLLTAEEMAIAAESGALFSVASVGAASLAGKIAVPFGRTAAIVAAKVGVNAALGGGIGYLASGGDVESAKLGAILGGGLSLASQAGSAVYGKFIKPYVTVAGARLQAAGQRYLTSHYLETGKVSFTDKAIAKILGLESASNKYITSGGEWTLAREETTINKALIPKELEPSKATPTQAWAKGTQWSKPSSIESSLNKYIGSGQAVSLKSLTAQSTIQKAITATLQMPSASSMLVAVTSGLAASTKTTQAQRQKSITVTDILGVSWGAASQQIANPFTTYQGKPYFRQQSKTREEYETVFLSYPLSGLAAPTLTTKYIERTLQVPTLMPIQSIKQIPRQEAIKTPVEISIQTPVSFSIKKSIQAQIQELTQIQTPIQASVQAPFKISISKTISMLMQRGLLKPILTQILTPIQKSALRQNPFLEETVSQIEAQTQKQGAQSIQTTVQSLIQQQKTETRLLNISDFDRTLGKSLNKELFGGTGRYKRQYPIMTGKQMLREVLKR